MSRTPPSGLGRLGRLGRRLRAARRVGPRLEAGLWQVYARLYDGLLDVFAYQDMIREVVDVLDPADQEVLDACAGTGNVSVALLAAGARRVVLVDASANMLARARRKLAPNLQTGRAELVEGDLVATMSALPAASVDRVSAVNCLYALNDRLAFFSQAVRVLRPGGFIVASHTTRSGSGPIVREQFACGGWRAVLRPRLIGIALVDLAIEIVAWQGRYEFAAVETLAAEAAAAGLTRTRFLGRTYGGGEDGINVLLTFSRDRGPIELPSDQVDVQVDVQTNDGSLGAPEGQRLSGIG